MATAEQVAVPDQKTCDEIPLVYALLPVRSYVVQKVIDSVSGQVWQNLSEPVILYRPSLGLVVCLV